MWMADDGNFWTVFPDDPDQPPQDFPSMQGAQEYADGLDCGYYIEHVS